MVEAWSYQSIVGMMLLYLLSITRPDIAFAVSQVVRSDPITLRNRVMQHQDEHPILTSDIRQIFDCSSERLVKSDLQC
jgi:hypothetical protein